MSTDLLRPVGARKYQGLQVLRITAAGMVVMTHSTFYASERLDRSFDVWHRGVSGVDIFFVLSGFVMIYSSTRLMSNVIGWKIFAERRAVRIIPIYWIATFIKLLALLFTSGYILHANFGVAETLGSFFFVPTRNSEGSIAPLLRVGWTLNFEMFFYLIFTLALFFRMNVYRFVGSVLAVLAVGAFFRQPGWPAASFYLDTKVLQFFYGMLIAKACLTGRHIPKTFALPLLGLGWLGLLGPWPTWNQLHGLQYGVAAALIVYSMASLEDFLVPIPPFILYGADASYAIYLFHPFIAPAVPMVFSRVHFVHPWLSVASSVVLGLVGGCLIHQYVEAPITNWFRDHLVVGNKKIIHPVATV